VTQPIFKTRLRRLIDRLAAEALREIDLAVYDARKALGLRHTIPIRSGYAYKLPERFQCPECGGRMLLEVDEWECATGMPTLGGIRVMCVAEEDEFLRAMYAEEDPKWQHQHWQDPGWMGLQHAVERYVCRKFHIVSSDPTPWRSRVSA